MRRGGGKLLDRGLLPGLMVLVLVAGVWRLGHPKKIKSLTTHLVISEIQTSGGTGHTFDEFVELYNPTGSTVDLTGMKLSKKTAGGAQSDLVATLSGTIAANRFFLIAPQDFTSISVAPDVTYATESASVADNNTVVLYDTDGLTVVDLVGMGSATASESATIGNPAGGKSIERKAMPGSTKDTMKIGGSDEFVGNGLDSGNNSTDFLVRDIPQPQNSLSDREPVAPTATVVPTPTETPVPTEVPTPTPELT
ncbi:lamin tail domain-containing protein, partial [Candidatus Amesbacteria bacterium]|nr:lamin tail domain-containing protein [Candidatus Amesbacteria bacterium]